MAESNPEQSGKIFRMILYVRSVEPERMSSATPTDPETVKCDDRILELILPVANAAGRMLGREVLPLEKRYRA